MKPITILSLLTFALATVQAKNAEPSSAVIKASKNNFKDLINSQEPVLVEFFAPWCGHCKKLAPEFEKAAAELEGQKIKLAAIDCDVETEICSERKIRGYPTMTVFQNGKEISQYGGLHEAKTITKFMKKLVSPMISKLTSDDELKKFKESDEVVVVGYFAKEANEAFTSVAEKLHNEYSFATMAPSSSAPEGSIFVYKTFDEKEAKFNDKLSFESLSNFVNDQAIPIVADLNRENYPRYAASGRPMAYFFYADEKQKEQYASALTSAAKAVKGKVNTVFINAGVYGHYAEVLNLDQNWPGFSIHDMQKDLKYPFAKGEKITADSMTKHLQSFVKGTLKPHFKSQPIPAKQEGSLTMVVHDNFEKVVLDKSKDVFLEVYSPGCGACKMIAPHYEELATKVNSLTKSVVLAKMDGTANDIPAGVTFKLEHYPTFLLFKAKTNEVVYFNGDLTFNSLAEFIEKNAETAKLTLPRKEEAAPEQPSQEQEEAEEEESEHDEL